ncbi:hypothetical protein Q7P37_006378 [Cladosporium fusiforme]
MAALHRDRGVGGSGYHNISRETQPSQLPNGACNFRDLSCGARAPVCGCKRFWLNDSNLGRPEQRDSCFCGHHACFHHWESQQAREPVQPSVSALREEAAPQVRSRNTPEGYYAVHQAGAGASPKTPTGLGIQPDMPSQSRSISTRMWEALNGFARHQDDSGASFTTSKLPSTAVPSINGDFIPPAPQRSMGPPLNIPSMSLARAGLDEYMGSATEVATPSVEGTPDLHPFGPGIKPRFPTAPLPTTEPLGQPIEYPMPPPPQPLPQQRHEISAATQQLLSRDMENVLQSYGRRIDVLESMSFSHVPVEEVHDKFEHHDVRLLDLEQWRNELEQERAHERDLADQRLDSPKASSSKRRRLLPNEASSFSSDGSFDNAAALHTEAAVLATVATNLELEPRFEALESRVSELENAAMPSYSQPWEVQVILLPWGRELKGIWFTTSEATQQSQRSSLPETEEWTGPQPAPKVSFHSSASTAWTTESIEAWAEDAQDWLSPKACGPSGTVYQRLASRGLIRNLTFTGSTSKHIMDTISNAFRKVLPSKLPSEAEDLEDYQGLQETFLPLRKVRKSSRLRFLTRAEMITSATWTADLLEDVIMKTNGQRRLYITTPHAYLQTGGYDWTWKSLRQLPARNSRGEVQPRLVKSGVAIEACWSYTDKLDYVPSLHSSFGSHTSSKSHHDPVQQRDVPPQPMSPLSEARPLRQRTVSLPTSETAVVALKRRAASFETSDVAPTSSDAAEPITAKRPRLTTSPEAERRGVGFTPRLSREPPSPFQSDAQMVDSRSQGATSSSRVMPRGTTPFAYATPHSNSHFIGMADLMSCGDGDTVLGTDIASDQADEEWQGVGDAMESEEEEEEQDMSSDEDDSSMLYGTDVDEEEGLTIYEP